MSGTVGPRISPFINTYSLDFDGVDDYVGLGNSTDLQITGAFSFSCWVNTTSTNYEGIYFKGNSVALSDIYIRRQNNGTVRFFINNVSKNVTSSTTVNDGNWHHIMCVYVPSTSMTIYIDGSQDAQNTTTIPAAINNNYGNITIGEGGGQYFDGNIDEVSIFNTDQSTNIATLSTAPTIDLTSLNPIAWYRMGDNGAYKDPQWLIPSNENKDKVSNYSFEFDGMNDYINIPNNTELNFASAYSVSCWIKTTSIALLSPISNQSKFLFRLYAPANQIRLQLYDGSGGFLNLDNTQSFNDGQWHHIAFTTEATTTADKVIVYFDGVALTNKGTQTNVGSQLSAFAYEIGRNSGTWNFNGGIDEVSLYDSELSASQINDMYNGGEPTTISGAVAHYKMGEEATFSGGVWTVPDAVGSNNGTSANMTIEDRVGEAPGSVNNALSFNMDEIDRVEDTPSTT
jgi:hypothetical protein